MSKPPETHTGHGDSKPIGAHEEPAAKPAEAPAAEPTEAEQTTEWVNPEMEPIDPNNPAAPRVPRQDTSKS
jgi:hypothetical protein